MKKKLFLHGGWTGAKLGVLGDLIYLDFENWNWKNVEMKGEVPAPRRWHTLTCLNERELSKQFVFGGYSGEYSKPFDDMFLFDIESQNSMKIIPRGNEIPEGRHRHSLTEIGNKELLLLGGHNSNRINCQDVYIFHTDNHSWSLIKNIGKLYPLKRNAHKVIKIDENCFILVGGYKKNYIECLYSFDVRMIST